MKKDNKSVHADPVTEGNPSLDPTAVVQDSILGRWTAVGARTTIIETHFGDYSYIMSDGQIIYSEIGKFCSIASHTRLNPSNHPLWRPSLHHFTYRSRFYGFGEDDEEIFQWRREHKVVLGHDVWIGHGAIILPGVKIGTGAAVGAGAVVTQDVLPFTIVAGVPARVIRRRVTEEVEASLMRIQWWNWSHDQLAEALEDFRHFDAASFAAKYDLFELRRSRKGTMNPLPQNHRISMQRVSATKHGKKIRKDRGGAFRV